MRTMDLDEVGTELLIDVERRLLVDLLPRMDMVRQPGRVVKIGALPVGINSTVARFLQNEIEPQDMPDFVHRLRAHILAMFEEAEDLDCQQNLRSAPSWEATVHSFGLSPRFVPHEPPSHGSLKGSPDLCPHSVARKAGIIARTIKFQPHDVEINVTREAIRIELLLDLAEAIVDP